MHLQALVCIWIYLNASERISSGGFERHKRSKAYESGRNWSTNPNLNFTPCFCTCFGASRLHAVHFLRLAPANALKHGGGIWCFWWWFCVCLVVVFVVLVGSVGAFGCGFGGGLVLVVFCWFE